MTDIEEIAEEISKLAHESEKPIYTSFMGEADVAAGIKILQKHHLPHYTIPEAMCKPYASTLFFNKMLKQKVKKPIVFTDVEKEKAKSIIDENLKSGKTYLPEYKAIKVLEAYKLPVLKNGLATSKEQAGVIADRIGYPVVMKIMSDQIVHKVDVQGVVLDVNTREEAEKTYARIISNVKKMQPEAQIDGILISKQVEGGTEVILGLKRDPSFGPVVMFGLGGIFVEILKDVSFRVAPINKESAIDMIKEIKSSKMLLGARGRKMLDIESIAEAILRISQLALECPQIKELDINPMIVLEDGKGCFVADTEIMI